MASGGRFEVAQAGEEARENRASRCPSEGGQTNHRGTDRRAVGAQECAQHVGGDLGWLALHRPADECLTWRGRRVTNRPEDPRRRCPIIACEEVAEERVVPRRSETRAAAHQLGDALVEPDSADPLGSGIVPAVCAHRRAGILNQA
jgi:hypothetical protein